MIPAGSFAAGLASGRDSIILQQNGSFRMQAPLSLWAQIREDYHAHGRDFSRPGFKAISVHRIGKRVAKIKYRLFRAPCILIYLALYRFVRNFYGIELPCGAEIGRRVVFEHQHGIVIHGAASIGDDCIIRHGVTLGIRQMNQINDAPSLGCRVNVGAGAKILGRVIIGDGAFIGANAVVLQDVPSCALAVGVPAKIVKHLDDIENDVERSASDTEV